MNNSEKEELEKIKQQQLINRILSRKEMETEALIEATRKNMKKSPEEIEIKKKEILKQKLAEQEKKEKEEIKAVKEKDLLHNMNKIVEKRSNTESELLNWNEEERKKEEERKRKVEEVLRQMEYSKRNKISRVSRVKKSNIEAVDREKYRGKYTYNQAKKEYFIYEQYEMLKRKQKDIKIEKAKEVIQDAIERTKPVANKETKKVVQPVKKVVTNRKEEIKKITENKQQETKRTIYSYKNLAATKVYQKVMDFYESRKVKHLIDIAIGRKPITSKNKRAEFAKTLNYKVDEKKANKAASKKAKPRYEPRYL